MKWMEIGDDIFCIRYEPLDQTIGAIRADDGLVVIDSRSHRVHAEELVDDLRSLDSRSTRYLINTHYHWDHTFGNAQFGEAAVLAHHLARQALIEKGEYMREFVVGADGVPSEMAKLVGEVDIVLPTVTFHDRMSLYCGDREIAMTYLGRGHTDNDIIIKVDDVVFAGDLIEVGAPPAFGDAFPHDWLTTLDAVIEHCTGPVVPGHGDVADRDFVINQRDEIRRAIEGEELYPEPVMEQLRQRLDA